MKGQMSTLRANDKLALNHSQKLSNPASERQSFLTRQMMKNSQVLVDVPRIRPDSSGPDAEIQPANFSTDEEQSAFPGKTPFRSVDQSAIVIKASADSSVMSFLKPSRGRNAANIVNEYGSKYPCSNR